MDDRPNTMRLDDRPDKECDTCNGNNDSFGGEQVTTSYIIVCVSRNQCVVSEGYAHLVDGEPDCRKGNEPEEEESEQVARSDPRRVGKMICWGKVRQNVRTRRRGRGSYECC